ncbi:MAG: hypothetical protein QM742_11955 [Aquabacterium sp.]
MTNPRRRIHITAPSFKPMVPDVLPVTSALGRSHALSSLMQRLRTSQACLEVVHGCLPSAMVPYVKAGPIDDEGWTLLAANSSVSAKLRQLQPRLMDALAARGLKVNAIRVRVQKG